MDCSTCKHIELSYTVEPCASCEKENENGCIIRTHYEHEEEKYCCDCKHVHTSDLDIPCAICNGHSKFEPKGEQKMDNRKTKAQLMEELEQKNAEIAELKKELKKSESYEQCVEAGRAIRESIDGLVEGGLTEDQAMMLLVAMVPLAPKFIR